MTTADRFRANPTVVAEPIGDKVVFFHAERGLYFTLDPFAMQFYTLLLEYGMSVASARMLELHDIDGPTMDAEIGALVSRWLRSGLIEPEID